MVLLPLRNMDGRSNIKEYKEATKIIKAMETNRKSKP
jgi:hypothetical protein